MQKKKRGGGDTAKTEAETHPSCSMKEWGTKMVLTMRSLISFFLKEGHFYKVEKDVSCRPITNYKNINKTLCAKLLFLTLKSVLSQRTPAEK